MGQARRYILECEYITPSGITTVSGTNEYNLLSGFTGTSIFDSGSTFSYSAITESELSDLSDSEYQQRVKDFLSYASQFEYSYTLSGLTALLDSAQYDDPINCSATTTTTTTTSTTLPPPTTTTTTTTLLPPTTTTTTTVGVTETEFGSGGFMTKVGQNFNEAYFSGTTEVTNYTTPIDADLDAVLISSNDTSEVYVSQDTNPSYILKTWFSMGIGGGTPQTITIDSASKPIFFKVFMLFIKNKRSIFF